MVTIADWPPPPAEAAERVWLARFARTLTGQVLEAVAGRLSAPRAPGATVTLAGHALPARTPGAGAANDAPPASWPARPATPGEVAGAWNAGDRGSARPHALTERAFLAGSSFALGGRGTGGDRWVRLWGRGAHGWFDGREDAVVLDGAVSSGLLGADVASARWTAGLALGHTHGAWDWRSPTGRGGLEAALTGVYPYAGYALSERVSAWAAGGAGAGVVTVKPKDRSALRADLTLVMGAAGVRGEIARPADAGLTLAVTADTRFTRIGSAAARGPDGRLAATGAEVWLARAGVEVARQFEVGTDGARVLAWFRGAGRLDGGDAETGSGLEVGGGIAWSDPASGLGIEVRARMLAAHADSDYEEWGASASARLDPGERGRGLSFSLSPTIGAASSATERLWGARGLVPGLGSGSGAGSGFEATRGLTAEAGYGMALFGDRFTGTPNVGFGMSDGGARDWRVGWRLTSVVPGDPGFEVSLDAVRREAANDDGPPEHGVMLRSLIRW